MQPQENKPETGKHVWPIAKFKARLAEAMRAAHKEPQIVTNDGKPDTVVIDYQEFLELTRLKSEANLRKRQAAIVELLSVAKSGADIEIPSRTNRKNPFDE